MNNHEKVIQIMKNVNQLFRHIKPEDRKQFGHQCSQYLDTGKSSKGKIILHTTPCRILYYDFNDNDATCLIEFKKFI
jgi:hypothetical protein